MIEISIDESLCTKCWMCTLACPYRIFVQKDEDNVPIVEFKEPCVSCGHCVALCPSGAITHSAYQMAGSNHSIDQSILRPIRCFFY